MLNENLPRETVDDVIEIATRMRKMDFFVRGDSISASDNIIDARGTRFPYTPVMVGEVVFRRAPERGGYPMYEPGDDCA